jgi:hypothetical protein
MNIELSGEDEGRTYHTDGGGIPGPSKQGTMKDPPSARDEKGSTTGFGNGFKGQNIRWPGGAREGMSQRSGFEDPS